MQQPVFSRVGCYVRVSTENQLENYSIGEQTERLKAYCKAKGWTIYKFYPDPGYSGGNTNRPALQQMLKDIHTKRIDMVAVYKLDRLSRSQKDTLTLIEDEFIANGVEFVSMSENFDTSTPFGRAMIGILSVFAQLEKDQITERFTMGRIGRSKAGYYHGGPTPPTGYDYVKGQLVVNEYKAKQVQEVFTRFLNGYSLNSIRSYMHKKYGGWNSSALVLNVLRNSVYVGKVKFKGIEYDGLQKPIIDQSSFLQVQELLNSPKRQSDKNSAQKTPFRAGYLLSSLVYCKRCGARYSANHGYYKCYSRAKSDKKYVVDPNCKNDNYKIEDLDNIVITGIRRLKYDQPYFESVTGKNDQRQNQAQKEMRARMKEIDRQIGRMIDLYQLGTIPIEQVSGRISDLQGKKDAIAEQLVTETKIESATDKKKDFIDALSRIDQTFNFGNLEEKRLLVSTLIESIWIDAATVRIKWRI
jgi:site-specific DNA recombinase